MVEGQWGSLEWRSVGYYTAPFPRSKLIVGSIILGSIGGIILGHLCTKYPMVQEFGQAIVGGNYKKIPMEEVVSTNMLDFNGNGKIDLSDYLSNIQIGNQD